MDKYQLFLSNLNKALKLDLTGYKRPQMERRINSLMRNMQIDSYDNFIEIMKNDRTIFNRFLDHLTINVSLKYGVPAALPVRSHIPWQ